MRMTHKAGLLGSKIKIPVSWSTTNNYLGYGFTLQLQHNSSNINTSSTSNEQGTFDAYKNDTITYIFSNPNNYGVTFRVTINGNTSNYSDSANTWIIDNDYKTITIDGNVTNFSLTITTTS